MRKLLWLLLFIQLQFSGCGSDNASGTTDASLGFTTITVNSVLARTVPQNVVSFRFSGTDANGVPVFGPVDFPKAPSIILTVPITMRTFLIEYLDGTGAVVGTYTQSVDLTAGEGLTIDDPAFVDGGGGGGTSGGGTNGGGTTGGPSVTATKLGFVSPIPDGKTNTALTNVTVTLQDANGATVTTATNPVTIALKTNPSGATLGGTLTVTPQNGVATFSDLTVDKAGQGYDLTATATGLTSADSSKFRISFAALAFVANPAFTIANGTNSGTFSSQGAATADFNKDGFADFVMANSLNTEDCTVCLGSAGGSFAQVGIDSNDDNPNAVTVGDYNKDGNPDFALCTATDIRVFLGNGAATPAFTQFDASNTGADRLATADFNGDGIEDLAGFDFNNDRLRILINAGNGQAYTETNVASGQNLNVKSLAAADFNSDGRPDLALGALDGGARVWTQAANGTFPAANIQTLAAPGNGQIQALSVGDFNGDMVADIFVAYIAPNTARLYPNQGGSFPTFNDQGLGSDPFGTGVGDFNLDGFLDAAVGSAFGTPASKNTEELEILLGKGDGTLGPVQNFSGTPNFILRGLTVGDYDGDGKLDAVAVGPFFAGTNNPGHAGLFRNTSN